MDLKWVLQRLKNAETTAPSIAPENNFAIGRGDHSLNPEMASELKAGIQSGIALRPAAVMVGLLERANGLHILLTRRTDELEHHPGQISFPGGHIEDDDIDATAAAIRETFEETGIGRKNINIIGRLDTYVTRTGFSIVPVIGHIFGSFDLRPDPKEVAEIFEVPLAHFMDPANHQLLQRNFAGNIRKFYAMPYGDYYIWGATAGMLFNLYEVLAIEKKGI